MKKISSKLMKKIEAKLIDNGFKAPFKFASFERMSYVENRISTIFKTQNNIEKIYSTLFPEINSDKFTDLVYKLSQDALLEISRMKDINGNPMFNSQDRNLIRRDILEGFIPFCNQYRINNFLSAKNIGSSEYSKQCYTLSRQILNWLIEYCRNGVAKVMR